MKYYLNAIILSKYSYLYMFKLTYKKKYEKHSTISFKIKRYPKYPILDDLEYQFMSIHSSSI